MSQMVQHYRVFVAAPAGLEAERTTFIEALREYNEMDALSRNVHFDPVAWEAVPGGIGRPQAIINRDLETCDYFILLLADRWGSKPSKDADSRFSSGSEEEFNLAMECVADHNRPMKDVVIFFKAVHPKQLGDPGVDLARVLDFRKALEESKEHFYMTFDEGSVFRQQLKILLARWVREHEKDFVATAGNNFTLLFLRHQTEVQLRTPIWPRPKGWQPKDDTQKPSFCSRD